MQTTELSSQNPQQDGPAYLTLEDPFLNATGTNLAAPASAPQSEMDPTPAAAAMTATPAAAAPAATPVAAAPAGTSFGVIDRRAFISASAAGLPATATTSAPDTITIVGQDGSEIAIDEENRICFFKDAAQRSFIFEYESSTGELAQVIETNRLWQRQRSADGKFSDQWINEATNSHWCGVVSVNRYSCSLISESTRIAYKIGGTKVVEHLSQDELHSRTKEDRYGNMSVEDVRKKKINYRFVGGRRAVRDLVTDSLLGYDAANNLLVMRDANGNRFEFSEYDDNNQPHTIVNELGTWEFIGASRWRNRRTGQLWHGDIKVHARGAYTFLELSGKITTRNVDGTTVEEYCGIRKIYGSDLETHQFTDGKPFIGPPVEANPKLAVHDGKLAAVGLANTNGELLIVHAHSDIHAEITAEAQQAVAAFNDGMVVYSSRKKDSSDRRNDLKIGLTLSELEAIETFRTANRVGNELIVVQCRDKKSQIVWYEFFWELEQVNVVAGDRVKAGQPIGRLNDVGRLKFAIRQSSVAGRPVAIASEF
ncbi:MAG TPA: hypothetical protein V6C72_03985 [Chroococcales cyanobacterium]